jgi:hypothetical protein
MRENQRLVPAARRSAAVDAMFNEFRRNGFVEGQNLAVIGSFGVTNEQIVDAVSAVVTATPDAIVAGPELYTRALQAATRIRVLGVVRQSGVISVGNAVRATPCQARRCCR